MGRDIQKGLENYFKGDNAVAAWTQVFKEFVGSMLVILVASQSGLDGWGWAISFVVMNIIFEGKNHLNSWITIYRGFTGACCCVQAIMFLGAQFLGAYVAFHLAGALNIEKDSHTCFNLDSWKDGIKEALAVCFFLWTYNHANKSDDVGMPKNVFLIAAIGASFFLNATQVFSYNRVFTGDESISDSGAVLLWGVVAVIVTHVKSVLVLGDKWFWECDEEAGSAEEKEPAVDNSEA